MSSPTAEVTFESAWEEFQTKVKAYNAKQKKQILHNTINAFAHILAAMPAPRREDDADPAPNAQTKHMIEDVENLISDRMHQQNVDKSLFLRWDTQSTGRVSEQQFRASIASLGLALTDEEMAALIAKYDNQGTGSINYADFWKYIQAASETPKSTNQSAYSSATLNRQHQTGKHFASLVREIPESLHERISRGLQVMRESMYQKSKSNHSLFLSLQNLSTKTVSVDDVLPAMMKLGFPTGLASEDELRQAAMRYSIKSPGLFSYPEFLAFFTGHEATPADPSPTTNALDSPALMNALVKVNNVKNLRKLFKDLDADGDGLITIDELARGLIETGGLHDAIAKDQAFKDYCESFCARKAGYLGYAEFIKFVGTRIHDNHAPISGEPLTGHAPVQIPEDATPSQMLELMVRTLRTSLVSVGSIFAQFDSNMDGTLNEEEFFQGVSALGFTLTQPQSKALFDAIDTNKNGTIDIAEFASLIVNPNRNPKLSTRVHAPPGGASSVPMGSYASNVPEVAHRPIRERVATKPQQQFHLSATQTPLSPEEAQALQPRPQVARTTHGDSTIDLSYIEQQPQPPTQTTEGDATAATAPRKPPPGGFSTIDFSRDHGAQAPRVGAGSNANRETDAKFLEFDPTTPLEPVKQRATNLVGQSSIELKDVPTAPNATPARSMVRPLHSPGGESSVSFNQNDSEVLRASRRVFTPVTNVSLKFEEAAPSPEAVQPQYRQQDAISIDLSFDPSSTEVETPRRVRRAGATPNVARVNLAHSDHREPADLNEPNGLAHRTRKHVESAAADTFHIGDNTTGSTVRSSYSQESPNGVDGDLIERLSKAIYTNSQRLRHSFQAFNKNSQSATLSKENFVSGVRGLKVDLTDGQADSLFARFDSDGDGAITYSEFVRLLASK